MRWCCAQSSSRGCWNALLEKSHGSMKNLGIGQGKGTADKGTVWRNWGDNTLAYLSIDRIVASNAGRSDCLITPDCPILIKSHCLMLLSILHGVAAQRWRPASVSRIQSSDLEVKV
ncbi:hypothetical protein VTN77DRAFT_6310 [Rasamsonia byssochlamydoides]|uniref:uncharacterized protein n=1 Tax=Rasamsonia byssochlamydoides TaxID=89139 RepID=UPI0037441677